ncbi:MAG TPA: glucans biosynthesis glucosyltransferase MdoH [Microvirga sp.]|jgi:membrane glycosyltransferase|nr:glucans biosynthesis glucosyltransferase MdoH [Microvirga sp.]
MTEPAPLTPALNLVGPGLSAPTGSQSMAILRRRRAFVIVVNLATYLALASWMAGILGAGGWTLVDILLFAGFLVATPWTVLGFWNAVLGVWLLHFRRDGMAAVAPFAAAGDRDEPIHARTAILMTLRNEDPARAFRRLRIVKRSVDATGFGDRFAYFVLSDTSNADVAAAEEAAFAAWRAESPNPDALVYRRRAVNTGFKAGNVREFCETHGRDFEFMLPLDADSLMSGEAIVRLVRIMQANPKLGILQSLVVGAPATSAFARIFQFGMRHGMRPYTMGSAWWTGECGPFWGHNALVRIQPFAEHCHLPILPGKPPLGGHVLSHDQVEATLMRRAGFEARVLPQEGGSWEENPPTIFEFSTRDLRWCQGNMQYFKLLNLAGLLPMSRFQLAWAILMFIGVPAMTGMIALAPLKALDGDGPFPAGAAIGLYLTFLAMYLSPKLAGLLDILLTPGGVARYGGLGRFLASAAVEVVFSFLLGAVTTFRLTLFMIGLVFGRSVVWNGQARDAHGVAWSTAMRGLWAPFLFGLAVCGALAVLAPAALLWSLPLTLGYLVAFPFAVVTAAPALGRWFTARGLCAIPEEFETPSEIRSLREAA